MLQLSFLSTLMSLGCMFSCSIVQAADHRGHEPGSSAASPLALVLVGITGEGKSETANTVYGSTNVFSVSSGRRSETRKCRPQAFVFNGKHYVVIDTPGLRDTALEPAQVEEEIRKVADLAPRGVGAFLFVVNGAGRFRGESLEALQAFSYAFPEALDHSALLVTHVGQQQFSHFRTQLLEDAEDIPALSKSLKLLGGRVGALGELTSVRRAEDRDHILEELVPRILDENGGQLYDNNRHLAEARVWLEDMEKRTEALSMLHHRRDVEHGLGELRLGRGSRNSLEQKLRNFETTERNAREQEQRRQLAEKNAREEEQRRQLAEKNAREEEQRRQLAEKNAREQEQQRQVAEWNAREEEQRRQAAEERARRAERDLSERPVIYRGGGGGGGGGGRSSGGEDSGIGMALFGAVLGAALMAR